MAPGMLPIPPSTAAVKALMPARKPTFQSTTPYCMANSTPAAAPSAGPRTKTIAITRSISMPMRLAASLSSAVARTARPNVVWLTR